MDTSVVVLALAVVAGLYVRNSRKLGGLIKATGKLGELEEKQRALLEEVRAELGSLRSALVDSGDVERLPRLPPPAASSYAQAPVKPPAAPPPAAALVKLPAAPPQVKPPAQPPPLADPPRAGDAGSKDDEPPSTKPSTSRRISTSRGGPAVTAPSSSPRPVSFDDQIRRALARMENRIEVPPEFEERWLARLRGLGAELNISEREGPTDEQVETMIRELYRTEADSKDARDAAAARPALKALPSATAPIAVRIAAAARGLDVDGEATILRGGAQPDDDPDDSGRDTGEEATRFWSVQPNPADAQIPGVPVAAKPTTVRPPHAPPRKVGDPLARIAAEVPESSATRTAAAFRKGSRPTLFGGIGLGAPRGSAPRPAPGGPQAGQEEGGEAQ